VALALILETVRNGRQLDTQRHLANPSDSREKIKDFLCSAADVRRACDSCRQTIGLGS